MRPWMLMMLLAAGIARGQPPAPPASPPAPSGTTGATGIRYEDLPPPVRLGVRAETVRRTWPAIPTLVIVPDEASYIQAIGAWTVKARYPVLIDDGTERTREDIARFVRAWKPAKVVRWQAPERAWPAEPEKRRDVIQSTVLRVWSLPMPNETEPAKLGSMPDLAARWKRLGVPVPGIVVADASDSAWPAALALAIGRCQTIAWVNADPNVNASMPREKAEALERDIEKACDDTGLSWRSLGDEIDSLTLCLNCPVKVTLDDKGTVGATTDFLGRHPVKDTDGKPGARDNGERWAWAGQVFGTAAHSAYCAMCSLFLGTKTAWVFDSYPDTSPWNEYDGGKAGKVLKDAGLDVVVDDGKSQGERAWRARCGFSVDAGFIAVNSKGMADEFNLSPGQMRPGDVPFLTVPSIVYLVHSWSAAAPGERYTVGGRWLERGAYAFLGSVYEPYLKAFLPTPVVAARMASAYAWGAAVRPDNNVQIWKLATIGDPLTAIGPAPVKADAPMPLTPVTEVESEMREAVAARHFEKAVVALTILGRDGDAAKLLGALIKEDPKALTAATAIVGLAPAMRARDAQTVLECYSRLSAEQSQDPVRRDILWHAGRAAPEPTEPMLQMLRANLRTDQIGRDAADLARVVASRLGRDNAIGMLMDARPRATTDYDRARIDETLKMLQSSR